MRRRVNAVFVASVLALLGAASKSDPGTDSPSGESMPVGDIKGWHMVFSDDFRTDVPLGSFPAAVWSTWGDYPDGWRDTSKHGTYMPSKVVSIHDGVMDLHLHTEGGVHMVAVPYPRIPGSPKAGQRYGRYAIRFRADPVPCYKTAWLLWPDSEVWPRDGEIDFPEGALNATMDAFMHRKEAVSGSDQASFSTPVTYADWHTAVIEWSPGRVTFILDASVIGSTTHRVPDASMHWVIQTETSLHCVPADHAEGHVLIDWVVVYSPSP